MQLQAGISVRPGSSKACLDLWHAGVTDTAAARFYGFHFQCPTLKVSIVAIEIAVGFKHHTMPMADSPALCICSQALQLRTMPLGAPQPGLAAAT